jgi:hypothetical protein
MLILSKVLSFERKNAFVLKGKILFKRKGFDSHFRRRRDKLKATKAVKAEAKRRRAQMVVELAGQGRMQGRPRCVHFFSFSLLSNKLYV